LGVTVFLVLLGAFIGHAQDLREDLKDAIKH
jgi:hypothetical protein